MTGTKDQIDVRPTKRFFVDMFTRDIPLEQAVLDLVDNCIDGAKRAKIKSNKLDKYKIDIKISKDEFRITDNCGGFDRKTAREYAFRFGRDEKQSSTHSIGQFGVGMKRALFKFGSKFEVRSAVTNDEWAIDINVNDWVKTEEWKFLWSTFKSKAISKSIPGTEIIVTNLKPEVSARFSTDTFRNAIIQLIKSKHRQFIAQGVSINVNGQHVTATDVYLLVGSGKNSPLRPGVTNKTFKDKGQDDVIVRIIVAVGNSSPREAGWNVIGNGRMILEADKSDKTGWKLIEDGTGKASLPKYHNQYSRFRGIVSFDSDDSSRIPWSTTKDDIDQDSRIWQDTLQIMVEMMRPVIDFLNELDAEIDEHGQEHSAMLDIVTQARSASVESFVKSAQFKAPSRVAYSKAPKLMKIKYSKPTKDVEFLMKALGASSADLAGEEAFDLVLSRHKR